MVRVWASQWAVIALTEIDDLPDGRLLVRTTTQPLVMPGREVEYGWTPLPNGPPPDPQSIEYVLCPARTSTAPTVRVEGRDGEWELDGEVRRW